MCENIDFFLDMKVGWVGQVLTIDGLPKLTARVQT